MTRPDPKAQHLIRVQAQLGYRFRNPALLRQALTHRSHSARNNERFEFVGDSILDYVVAKMLFDAFPNLPEGRLSPMRAQLVKEATLAETARSIGIGSALNLGVGELKSGGSDRDSILADAMEALFAAISFDSDFAAAGHDHAGKRCQNPLAGSLAGAASAAAQIPHRKTNRRGQRGPV